MDKKDIDSGLKTGVYSVVDVSTETIYKKRFKSDVYKHFFRILDSNSDEFTDFVQCKTCLTILTYNGTAHLRLHSQNCTREETVNRAEDNVKSFVQPKTRRQANEIKEIVERELSRWSTEGILPLSKALDENLEILLQRMIHVGSKFGNVRLQNFLNKSVINEKLLEEVSALTQELREKVIRAVTNGSPSISQLFLLSLILISILPGECTIAVDFWRNPCNRICYLTARIFLLSDWDIESLYIFTSESGLSRKENLGSLQIHLRNFSGINSKAAKIVSNDVEFHNIGIFNMTTELNNIIRCSMLDVDGFRPLVSAVQRDVPLNENEEMPFAFYDSWIQVFGKLKGAPKGKFDDKLIAEIIALLAIFKEAVSDLEVSTVPQIQTVLLWQLELIETCEAKNGGSLQFKELKKSMQSRLENLNISATHMLATFLDPKFKQLKMLSEAARTSAMNSITRRTAEICAEFSIEETQAIRLRKRTRFEAYAEQEAVDGISAEIQMYLGSSDFESPLQWWRQNKNIFPRLSVVVRKIMILPAASTFSNNYFETKFGRESNDSLNNLLFKKYNKK